MDIEDIEDQPNNDHLFENLFEDEENWLLDWEEWWRIIIHRNANVMEAEPPDYPDDTWTLSAKDPPFPFNLDETWYCAALLALILAIHYELDTAWLLQHGYRHYILRISSKAILTVVLSFASTMAYEIFGNLHEMVREGLEFRIAENLRRFLDRPYLNEDIKRAVSSTIVWSFQCFALLISSTLSYVGPAALVWLAGWISTNLANFIFDLGTILALPTPGVDGIFDLKVLFWEFGVPAYFQVCVAAFLYLCVFLFMSRAEKPIMLGRGAQDPFSKLAFELLRATAMHLLAYTAYQLVCICAVSTKVFILGVNMYDPLTDTPLALKSNTQLSPSVGILVLSSHWVVKRACMLCVWLAWPLWVPYMVWLSIKTRDSTRDNWDVYWLLLDEDMDVLNPDKRVIARVMMTALFGLKSSWPARMRLSIIDGVD
ncbi:hypothetical protein F4818DRAFT_451458 [Hypoxylon cercidicola]|nr:hypothetical protein F4818DRAFT_451458 [Hypoxylon cercidicola]